ncbi:hypothetical protein AB0L64_10290 [Kribbella sp. NPDC051936]|uniref:hypothetical protein n=1 Tax=Kribbella sp. NPDC051936 TaxID=3154946 RepID=UPI0034234A54
MDPVISAYSALEAAEGDIKKDRAVERAIRLIAKQDLTVLEPSRATVASISDDDAWSNTRPRRWIPAVAAVLSLATALWPLAKDIGQLVGH